MGSADLGKVGIISVDGHAKAPWPVYREYLDPSWRANYDDWVAVRKLRPDFVHAGLGEEAQWNPQRRLADLEAKGVIAEVLFSNGIPFERHSDPSAVRAGYTAYNRWVAETCSETQGRMLPQAHVEFSDPAAASKEIHAAKQNGFVSILLPPLTPASRYFFDPALDPIWNACVETGLPIAQHGGVGAPRYEPEGPSAFLVLATEHSFFSGRSLWQLILGGVFDRFPNLKVAYVETESWWLRPVMQLLDRRDRFGDEWAQAADAAKAGGGRPYKHLPSTYLQTNVFMGISPFVKDIATGEFDDGKERPIITTENAMIGVDYPHPETALFGLTEAIEAFANLPNVTTLGVQKVVYGNAARIFGIDLAKLQPLIDRIGFTLRA